MGRTSALLIRLAALTALFAVDLLITNILRRLRLIGRAGPLRLGSRQFIAHDERSESGKSAMLKEAMALVLGTGAASSASAAWLDYHIDAMTSPDASGAYQTATLDFYVLSDISSGSLPSGGYSRAQFSQQAMSQGNSTQINVSGHQLTASYTYPYGSPSASNYANYTVSLVTPSDIFASGFVSSLNTPATGVLTLKSGYQGGGGWNITANVTSLSVSAVTTPNLDISQVNVHLQTGVPEPASWAMMAGGFGLIGAGLRRRKAAISFG